MKTKRAKMLALAGSAMLLFQAGGCFLTDLLNSVVGSVSP